MKCVSTPRSRGRTSGWDQVELIPSFEYEVSTHAFDLLQIRHSLDPKSFDAHPVPTQLAFPNIRESPSSMRSTTR